MLINKKFEVLLHNLKKNGKNGYQLVSKKKRKEMVAP